MRNFFNNQIFPTFVTSAEIDDIDNAGVLADCYKLKDIDGGLERSNRDGWHSNLFTKNNPPPPDSYLAHLEQKALEFGNKVLELHKLKYKISSTDWWININHENSYNVVHSHPKADLSIVYYAQVPADSGSLVLIRNDGAVHTRLFAKAEPEHANRFEMFPEVGRMYAFPAHVLHYVMANSSSEDRVSIAFNMNI